MTIYTHFLFKADSEHLSSPISRDLMGEKMKILWFFSRLLRLRRPVASHNVSLRSATSPLPPILGDCLSSGFYLISKKNEAIFSLQSKGITITRQLPPSIRLTSLGVVKEFVLLKSSFANWIGMIRDFFLLLYSKRFCTYQFLRALSLIEPTSFTHKGQKKITIGTNEFN